LSRREIEAGDTIEMAVYAHGAVALAGFSTSVRFDTLQLARGSFPLILTMRLVTTI
jgi:hypothetical protein